MDEDEGTLNEGPIAMTHEEDTGNSMGRKEIGTMGLEHSTGIFSI